MADIHQGKLTKLGERLNQAAQDRQAAAAQPLTCQWCSVALPPGTTICPTCGSTGIPNESMVVPDVAEPDADPLQDAIGILRPEGEELTEWWNADGEIEPYRNSAQQEGDMMPVILGLLGTGVVCVLLGVLVAPTLLASVFENSLGVTVKDNNDLRPLGGVLGLLTGAFISAIGLLIAAPRR